MKESAEQTKARLAERARLSRLVGEFLRARVEAQLAEGKTQITFDELTEGYWEEEPLLSFAKTWVGKNADVWKRSTTGEILYHMLKADERFELSYYPKPKEEDKRGKARLYVVKAQLTQTQSEE